MFADSSFTTLHRRKELLDEEQVAANVRSTFLKAMERAAMIGAKMSVKHLKTIAKEIKASLTEDLKDAIADVRAFVHAEGEACTFSLNGEPEGTVTYKQSNGWYMFDGFVCYEDRHEGKRGVGVPHSMHKTTKTFLVRPPSMIYDDPLPLGSSGILTHFAKVFLRREHIDSIMKIREVFTSPLETGDVIPKPGDKVTLSHDWVEALELTMTHECRWKPTRFITHHESLFGKRKRIQWPLGGSASRSGHVVEDPVFISRNSPWCMEKGSKSATGRKGAHHGDHDLFSDASREEDRIVLTARKMQQLLELTVSMEGVGAISEIIARGMAANMNGNTHHYDAHKALLLLKIEHHILDFLEHHSLNLQFGIMDLMAKHLPWDCENTRDEFQEMRRSMQLYDCNPTGAHPEDWQCRLRDVSMHPEGPIDLRQKFARVIMDVVHRSTKA
eukprot:CAMPEP_0181326470 /NCGR_PEP_ID=MMETSP1101-20121128/21514_1 /TAXON_ID=46948 /ORGANISM="Rhodomonas abbreviata, Strain Caron Lab Isolate" /LENGTH=442 /DNA_ID=CAMNT_0023434923 /DNA_START=420 /DNA_END=1748 /DNA_ORIENTATION=-